MSLSYYPTETKVSDNSPYHIDALHTLYELKREGLIQSISTKNFPPSLLLESSRCGFNINSNDVVGNIMNTNNLQYDSPTVANRLISAPLGGGLFTNQFNELQEWVHLLPAKKNNFDDLLQSCCATFARSEKDSSLKWKTYRMIMDSLVEMSFKYQVSVESIVLRWLLQLNNGDSVCVGTLMGMNLVEDQGGRPYNRHRDLREVFTFSLEENDVDELRKVSDLTSRPAEADIDFTDWRLSL
jgi:aryl-alcohol dehydrogenase-like predicted oxidoreductase